MGLHWKADKSYLPELWCKSEGERLVRWTEQEKNFLKENYQERRAKEIADDLSRSIHSVYHKARNMDLRKLENTFEKSSSKNLAYILGVLKGDGYVSKQKARNDCNYHVGLKVLDLEFALDFKRALEDIGLKSEVYEDSIRFGKLIYFTKSYSKRFYEWYNELSLDKIYDLLESNDMKREFVRGIYESDGNLDVHRKRYPRIRVCSSNERLLKFLGNILQELGFDPKYVKPSTFKWNNRTWILYELRIYKIKQVKEFLKEIDPVIPRKSLKRLES